MMGLEPTTFWMARTWREATEADSERIRLRDAMYPFGVVTGTVYR